MSFIVGNLRSCDSITSYATISADCIDVDGVVTRMKDNEELRKIITEILLSDPNSEEKRLAEEYLIQCLYDVTNDPEKNPVLQKFLDSFCRADIEYLLLKVEDLWRKNENLEIIKDRLEQEVSSLRATVDYLEYRIEHLENPDERSN